MVELEISGLGRTYGNGGAPVEALKGLDLRAGAGSFTVVVGASGCGKTTLLRLIAGLERPGAGTIVFRDSDGLPAEKPRFGFMFQDARLLPWLTVEKNLALAFPEKCPEAAGTIERVLDLVGLGGWAKAYPRSLSGGMAQRAALARALCRKPEILLLDEPFGALDALTRTKLRKELDELWRRLGLTVVLVTHDIEEAVYLADRVVVMEAGRIVEEFVVSLTRPREHRAADFQRLCAAVEGALKFEQKYFPSAAESAAGDGKRSVKKFGSIDDFLSRRI